MGMWPYSNRHISINNIQSNPIGQTELHPESNKEVITLQLIFDLVKELNKSNGKMP